jgi:putative tricarboxylic transport membrane protein
MSLHGVAPGREMLVDHLSWVFVLIWSLFLSNWITSLLGLALVNPLARLSTVSTARLIPFILALATIGAVQYRGLLADLMCAVIFGFIGYFMKRYDWPRLPLVMAFALAPLFETNLHLTMRLHELGRIEFWSRPIVIGLLLLSSLNFVLPLFLGGLKRYRRPSG